MINYDFPLYRPPAEADNIIIQATLGCSHNRCSFCTMYKTKRYTVRPLNEVHSEIEALAHAYPNANKVFLADGDALALSTRSSRKVVTFTKNIFSKTLTGIALCHGAELFGKKC